MTVKQLSVFIENRQGRLGEVLSVLKESGANILSMSLADTTEYGLLRIMVTAPEKAKDALNSKGFAAMVTDVLVIKIPHKAGSLQSILEIIAENNINIEYMYGLSIEDNDAYVVFKPSDAEKTSKLFEENGIETLTPSDLLKVKL